MRSPPKWAIKTASLLWSTLNYTVRSLCELAPKVDLGIPVISIGNLQSGGSGKTPVVIEVVRILKEQGRRPAVLTRGYHSKMEKTGGLIYKERSTQPLTAFGDEAVLIYVKAECPVFVGRDRELTYFNFVPILLANERPDVLVLDDGFQQFRLKKNLEIVCLTSKKPGEVIFRDFESTMPPEVFRLLTKSDPGTDDISSLSFSGQVDLLPVFDCLGVTTTQSYSLVTGFAGAERLKNQLEETGISVAAWYSFSDHYSYSKEEIRQIEKKAGGQIILTSEKDWVKIKMLTESPKSYRVLKLELKWKYGKMELIDRLCKLFPV